MCAVLFLKTLYFLLIFGVVFVIINGAWVFLLFFFSSHETSILRLSVKSIKFLISINHLKFFLQNYLVIYKQMTIMIFFTQVSVRDSKNNMGHDKARANDP